MCIAHKTMSEVRKSDRHLRDLAAQSRDYKRGRIRSGFITIVDCDRLSISKSDACRNNLHGDLSKDRRSRSIRESHLLQADSSQDAVSSKSTGVTGVKPTIGWQGCL